MREVISYISAVLISTLFFGSVVVIICFAICKITKQEFRKNTVLRLYMLNLIIFSSIFALTLLFSKASKEQILGSIYVLVFIGIIVFLVRLVKGKTGKNAVKGIKETKCTCLVCGNVWYYDKQEYLENKGQRMINSANQSSNCSSDLLCCSGCWPALFIPRAQQVPVKNLNKCPKCNSSAISREEVVHTIPQ